MNTKVLTSAVFLILMNLSVFGYVVVQDESVYSNFVVSDSPADKKQDYPVRGEIRKTFQLSPNADVEVEGIEGSVEVETTGGNTAELHFVRYGLTQADYDCETIVVEHSPEKLVVRHQTNAGKQCRIIQAREEMKLVIPRSANLSFNNIEGDCTIGKTEGFLRLKNIEGTVRAEEVRAAEISSVEDDVSINVAQLNSQGISVRNVEGAVELGVIASLNADLRIGNARNTEIDIPNVQTSQFGRGDFRLQLGSGGAGISITGIEGNVKIRRI